MKAMKSTGDAHYATLQTSLGWVLAASDESGIFVIDIGDSESALIDALIGEHRNARPAQMSDTAHQQVEDLNELIENPTGSATLRVSLRGTTFQQRVWELVREIPSGEITTYTAIAARMDRSDAARAVAGAVASNRLAVAVPCHRVIRSDGSPGGYRWGLHRKTELLRREGVILTATGRVEGIGQLALF